MIFWHKFRNSFQHGVQYGRAARFAPILLLVLCFTAVQSFAQINTGSLAGTVTDAAGGVLPGVAVVATETQSGSVYRTTTSSSGAYVFTSLRPGTYDVTAEASGFKLSKATGIPVFVTTRASHDFALDIGAASDTVTVNADAPSLETETSDVGTVLSEQQVQDLPSAAGGAMRSLAALTLLTPGAVGTGTNGGTAYVKIGGGQTFGSDNLLDGLSTQRSENGTELFDQMTPSLDAIEQFRVETLAPPAYLGRTTGGLANFKTKGGTNSYHGTVYDFYKNTIFDANYWFNKGNANLNGYTQDNYPGATPGNPNPFRRGVDMHQDYGITLGGPVRIPHFYNGTDKTFFFFSYEQVPSTYSHVGGGVVPTLAQRNGDFSSTLGAAIPGVTNPCVSSTAPVLSGQIYDPLTTRTVNGVECRTPFANNQIPVDRSVIAQKVLSLIPLPNYVAPGNSNYIFTAPQKVNQFDYSLRLDQSFGTRHHLFFFANARENFSGGTPNFPGPIDNGGNLQDFYAKLLRVGYDFTITPRLINQVNIGGNRINSFNSAPAALNGINYDTTVLGLDVPRSGNTFPTFGIQDMSSLGSANADDNVDNALLVDDNLSWQKGKHSVRVGGTYRWTQFSYENNGPAAGNFSFSRTQTAGTNNATAESQSGNGIASFLLGTPSGTNRSLQIHFPRWIQNYYAVYAQDDWKLRQNLTLNLGIRYSVDTPRHEAEGDISSFDPNEPNPAANGLLGALHYGGVGAGRDGNKGQQFAATYFKNIEPRIGFAYSPGFLPGRFKDKVVLRGAYTIMSGPLIYADYGQGTSAGFTTMTPGQTNDPFTFPRTLDSGLAPLSLSPIIDPTYNTANSIDYVAKGDGRPSQVQNWTLETQTELLPDLILTVGYLGERGTHLRSLVYWENSLNPAYFALGDTLFQQVQSPAAAAAGIQTPFANFFNVWPYAQVGQALLPHPQYGYINNDSYLQNRGQSTYNAMEVKLDRKFRNGLNLLAGYTYSKTFTDADSIQPYFATVLAQSGTQNPYNLKAERSVSEQDVTNNFVASYLYELPVGKGKKFLGNSNKIVDTMVSGYRIGGVLRYISGQPIGFYGAQGVPYFDGGIRFSRAVGNSLLTPAAKSGHLNPFSFKTNASQGLTLDDPNPTAVFNRLAFIDVNEAINRGSGPYRFGDMPRNDTEWRTDGFANEDMNLNKHIPIREGISADLRWEVFNVFNRHVFNKPDSGVNDTNFGQINGLIDGPRNMQLVLKIRY